MSSSHFHQMRTSLLHAGALNLLFSFPYSGMMYWIASNIRVLILALAGSSGRLFFLPLAALTVVLHLITRLSSTKSKLETLFGFIDIHPAA